MIKPISLSLMTASICNLNCSFCFLHNKQYYATQHYHDIIKTAWETGSYLQNIEEIFSKYNFDPYLIQNISLWGGETLLDTSFIIKNIQKIYEIFPAIKTWFFSTNFMIDINNIINLLLEIDQWANSTTEITLQLSIDGPPGVYIEEGHNGDWNIYENNLSKLISFFNEHKFNHILLNITMNSVLSKDIFINELDTEEKIIYYLKYMNKFFNQREQILNNQLYLYDTYKLPKLDSYAPLTAEERTKVLYIFQLFETIKKKLNNCLKYTSFSDGISHSFIFNTKIYNPNIECETTIQNLSIMPDGTLVRCSSSHMINDNIYAEELIKNNNLNDLRIYEQETVYAKNLIDINSQEFSDYSWQVFYGTKNTVNTYLKFCYCACKELLDVGQISVEYNDKQKLLTHLLSISHVATICDKNNVETTRIPYMSSLNIFRKYLNGITDLGIKNKKTEILETEGLI